MPVAMNLQYEIKGILNVNEARHYIIPITHEFNVTLVILSSRNVWS